MGIDGLNKFLKTKFPNIYTKHHISHFAYKKISWDVSSYIYKYMSACGKENNAWLRNFACNILLFRKYQLHIVPIFDGKAPKEKAEEHKDRKLQKNKLSKNK